MKRVLEYRPAWDEGAGFIGVIVKAAHGDAAARSAYMPLMQSAGSYYTVAHKRPQAKGLHRPWAACARCGGATTGYQWIESQHHLLNDNDNAIKRRSYRYPPSQGMGSGCSTKSEQEKR